MHDDRLIRRGIERRVRDHLLEYRPSVIGGGSARLDVFHRHREALILAPVPHLPKLIRDGQVLFGLLRRGNPSVERNRHVLVLCLLSLLTWESFVSYPPPQLPTVLVFYVS